MRSRCASRTSPSSRGCQWTNSSATSSGSSSSPPKQLIIKTRLDAATRLLAGDESIAAVAYACGYADHSAFSRQFKATVGLSPGEYRRLRRGSAERFWMSPHAAAP